VAPMSDRASPSTTAQATTDHAASPKPQQPIARNVMTELVGTSLVMLAGPGAIVLSGGAISDLAVALSFGAAMAIAIGVIRAVANPMFTLALVLIREISPRDAVGDWTGQALGGIIGGALIWGINDLDRAGVGANGWDRNGFGELGSVIAAELVFGVFLVVVLLAAISQRHSTAAIAAFTGGMYAVGMLVLRGIDGGGLNPARSIGSAIFSDTDPNALAQLWVFVLVPLVAAFAAVFVWLAIDDADLDDTVFDETILDDAQNLVTGDATD
jgi:aquaporin Z